MADPTLDRFEQSLLAESLGQIDFSNGRFKVMLLREAAALDLVTDATRSAVLADELSTGGGYVTGGLPVAVTPSLVDGVLTIALAAVTWPAATFTTGKAIYYQDA